MFIRPDSSSTSWLWMFSEPEASASTSLARLMSAFSLLIWSSRSLIRSTLAVISVSTVRPSSAIELLIRAPSFRKSSTLESAWLRSRLDEGSLAVAAKELQISSRRAKKKLSPEGSPNRLWALSMYWATTSQRLASEAALSVASCRYWSVTRLTPETSTPMPRPPTTSCCWSTVFRT